MRYVSVIGVVGFLLLGISASGHADASTKGNIWLSTPAEKLDSYITTFPIIVHLEGVPEFKELAIQLKWEPFDGERGCYKLVSSPRSATSGWALAEHPKAEFDGDPTYTWSIHFPKDGKRDMVTFWMSAGNCEDLGDVTVVIADARFREKEDDKVSAINAPSDSLVIKREKEKPSDSRDTPVITASNDVRLSVSPSPAVNEARLKFRVPARTAFGLGIYDVSGRVIRRVEALPDAYGSGEGVWDLRDNQGARVARGVYFARIVTPSGSASRQIIVAR